MRPSPPLGLYPPQVGGRVGLSDLHNLMNHSMQLHAYDYIAHRVELDGHLPVGHLQLLLRKTGLHLQDENGNAITPTLAVRQQ